MFHVYDSHLIHNYVKFLIGNAIKLLQRTAGVLLTSIGDRRRAALRWLNGYRGGQRLVRQCSGNSNGEMEANGSNEFDGQRIRWLANPTNTESR